MDKPETKITFLGTASCVPAAGHDTSSFIINDRYLVDTGWYSAIKMLHYDISPPTLDAVFISHCHHDHYIGLPHILFYRCMRQINDPGQDPLKIIGPANDIERVVNLAATLLQPERFPDVNLPVEIVPVTPGESISLEDFQIVTCKTVHPVQGLCYRFTNKITGASFVYTGDTAYHPPIAEHARGVSLLIHEASHGPDSPNRDSKYGHSGAPDAAEIAKLAEAKSLALVHCPESLIQPALSAARKIFPVTFIPEDGQDIIVENI